ncbi:hypothetical protein [Rhodanobacter sp. DHG33]|uniref:hypothetical protein n=1 Tax=Rhodanobacter sp. DHG33 TaxID=2775921 RepID=UPI0017840C66|nr:hypothetical protein [Rhodanobacter sp. DHG33]MBD8899737.1 hypothetical protein [Rhodanobacter sp. DHG33]
MNIRPLLPLCAGLLLAGCATTPPRRPAPPPAPPALITGVASCDAYLSSYLACHRTAGIFPADQLQARYQAMHDTLLQAAQNPQSRPYLDARCRLLASQMSQSLQGRSCNGPAAAAGTR